MISTNTHIYFWGSIYSNWCPSRFIVDNVEFNCAEQYLMYWKAQLFGDSEMMEKILKSKNPKEQKAFGRQVKNFDADIWNHERFDIMRTGLLAKFSQNEDLLQEILKTGNKIFVEGSPYDTIWGVGLHFEDHLILNERNWRGTNLLGKALTEIRDVLRNSNLEN